MQSHEKYETAGNSEQLSVPEMQGESKMTHLGASCNLAKPQDITDQLANSEGIRTQFGSWLLPNTGDRTLL